MVMNYISLKFLLSAMTGAIVGIIMVLCGVKIGAVWGLLAFMLNFIPNVGSISWCSNPRRIKFAKIATVSSVSTFLEETHAPTARTLLRSPHLLLHSSKDC